ncbi:MAG: phosphate/phosphite/phosphonate ABC transporter substrate-binding protein [Gammaproteobacteria bacterium]
MGWPIRGLIAVVFCAVWLTAAADDNTAPGQPSAAAPVRIGLTAVILTDRQSTLKAWSDYLQQQLQQPVQFLQRRTYYEIMQLLLEGKLDFAWVCGYPYVAQRDRMRLTAVPLYQHQPLYQSYLIVPADDLQTRRISDLAGMVFAFSDPDSNSGYLAPQFQLREQGLNPAQVFRKTFFTWSHQDVVRAVAEGVAQGGAVDGYVWETLARLNPQLTAKTRVAARSPWYGFPPIVSSTDVSPALFAAMRQALLTMASNPQGQAVLTQLNLDGFTPGNDTLFDGIAAMAARINP